MRNALIALWIMLLCSITSVAAQVSVGIGLPGVSIGINLPVYPELVPVPGYPVYYAPQVSSNYFFYDGMYWVYQRDNWYASSWYNGPWMLVAPEAIPLFVLRVPVRYYRRPPAYFRGWRSDAPPHWGEHWGNSWEQRRSGWDMWDRRAVPPPAPLPVYQRQYSGNRYPRVEQQQALQTQNYRYQPQDDVVRQHYQAQPVQSAPAPSPQARQAVPQERSAAQDQRAPPAIVGPAKRCTGPARTTAANGGWRCSKARSHERASTTGDPASRPAAGPASAAGAKDASPGQRTAGQATSASRASPASGPATAASPASDPAATARRCPTSGAGTEGARSGQTTARQGTRAGAKAGPGEGLRQG